MNLKIARDHTLFGLILGTDKKIYPIEIFLAINY